METRTIFWLVIVGLILAITIVSVMSKKKKKTSDDEKKEGGKRGGSRFMTILQVVCFIIFIGLLIYVIVDYYQEKVYPWDYEVKVDLWEKFSDGSEKKTASFQTPKTIPFDYAFDLRTKGRPCSILWSGTSVPICYCDDDKDPYISERYPGPNTITRPTKACWKMCWNRNHK